MTKIEKIEEEIKTLNTTASASHAAFGYMSNYSPQVEGMKQPSITS